MEVATHSRASFRCAVLRLGDLGSDIGAGVLSVSQVQMATGDGVCLYRVGLRGAKNVSRIRAVSADPSGIVSFHSVTDAV